MSDATALSLRAVEKRFGATIALDGATIVVRPGSIHALLGENGAGKSTLMRIAYGLEQADAGVVELDGRTQRFASPREARAAGLGMVQQHFSLVPAFTVAENVALGGYGRFSGTEARARALRIAEETGLDVNPDALVRELPVSAQQRAELVRALAEEPSVLVLDEPTAVLTPTESEELYSWMRRFAARGGSVVLITHRLREALGVADDVTVLRRGRSVLRGSCAQLSEAELVEAVVGDYRREAGAVTSVAPGNADVVFALEDASFRDARGVQRLAPTNLVVRAGEILGVLGVDGSGQAEMLRLLAGRLAASSGRVRRPARVGFIPGDRLRDGVIPTMSVAENHALAGAAERRGRIDWSAVRRETQALLDDFDVRAEGPTARLATLSGGNQQRFVVGRERRFAPQALVAEQPTRGLDVRATARVHAEIRSAAAEGSAVVLHSADLEEVLALSTRVVACFGGTVREVAAPADPTDRRPYARALLGAS
ncbi:MAG: ATP-binding cassette domain-containing protein [Gemmatimonadaceae bacterium]|nr:ATP-binding cassette domain-containing protein [Gemmatimonadaceae bacterium]